jgi:hypothetical protein
MSIGTGGIGPELTMQDVEKRRRLRSRVAQALNVPTTVRLGLSLAAALSNDAFEHPEAGSEITGERLLDMASLCRGQQTGGLECLDRQEWQVESRSTSVTRWHLASPWAHAIS